MRKRERAKGRGVKRKSAHGEPRRLGGMCTGANRGSVWGATRSCGAGVCNTGTGVCSNPNAADGTTCNDNNACTQTSTCQTGMCTGANPVVCTASDECHVAGVCNPANGTCSNPAGNNGAVCNDNNACTNGTTCQNGACAGGTPITCTTNPCHAAGACNPATGCPAPKPNGTACNDGNACTTNDTCNGGNCQGGPAFTCVAPDVCQNTGTCDINRPLPTPPSTQNLLGWWKLDGNGDDATPGNHIWRTSGGCRSRAAPEWQ